MREFEGIPENFSRIRLLAKMELSQAIRGQSGEKGRSVAGVRRKAKRCKTGQCQVSKEMVVRLVF
jgi:hypothetical protein